MEKEKIAVVFPGQGAQYVGMGKQLYENFPAARNIFHQSDKILKFAITELIFQGPEEELTRTKNSQPAIFILGIAAYKALKEKAPQLVPAAFAGLSLGEYTAFTAAESFSFEDGLDIVRKRGAYMDEASQKNPGTMASIIGLDEQAVREICTRLAESFVINIANVNCPGQIVISGEKKGIEIAVEEAKKIGAKRAIELKVSGAFHSGLMASAQEKLAKALDEIEVKPPKTPVITNVSADFEDDVNKIKELLAKQVTNTVLWQKSIEKLIDNGIEIFIEVGCGKVLQGLIRRINKDVTTLGVEEPNSLEETLKFL